MGRITLWDRIWPWLLHPFRTAAVTITFRYCENHDLEIHLAPTHIDYQP